jgi:uncharacterized membrane protein SpoIIM required for sporulation
MDLATPEACCQNPDMDFNTFLQSRQPRWQRLTLLLDRIDRFGVASLPPEEVDEFFRLYRLTSSDLNLAQTRTGNPVIIEYLEGLVGRAYGTLSVPRRVSLFRSAWSLLRHYFPATIRRQRAALLLSTLILIGGVCFGFIATMISPDSAEIFLPAEHLVQTPRERVTELEDLERRGESRIQSTGEHGVFTTFLFSHNIRVSILAFALGLTFGVGTAILLFYNGAMLGSLAALYWSDGVFMFFIAWIGPHGSIELPCVVFSGMAGFMLARTQLSRDRDPWTVRIRKIRTPLVDLLIGASCLLVIAGTVEGGFSQINEPTLPYPVKIAVAVGLFTALLAYLFWIPVKPRSTADES